MRIAWKKRLAPPSTRLRQLKSVGLGGLPGTIWAAPVLPKAANVDPSRAIRSRAAIMRSRGACAVVGHAATPSVSGEEHNTHPGGTTMQVHGLANSFLSLVGLAAAFPATEGPRRLAAPEAAPEAAPGKSEMQQEPSASAMLRSLAAQYDVRDITPRQFGALLHELQAGGAVPAAELVDLTQLRLALDHAGFDPDEPLDLIAFVESQLRDADVGLLDMAQQAAQSPLRRQLAWLTKFELLRYVEPLRAAA